MARHILSKAGQRDNTTSEGGDHNGHDVENGKDEENHGQDESHNNNCDNNNFERNIRGTSNHPFKQDYRKNFDRGEDIDNADDVDEEQSEISQDVEESDEDEPHDMVHDDLYDVGDEPYRHDDRQYVTDRSSTTSLSVTPDGAHNLDHRPHLIQNQINNSDPSSHNSHNWKTDSVSSSDNQLAKTQAHYLEMNSQFTIPEGQTRVCDCCYCEVFGHGSSPMAPTSRNYAEMRERLRQRLTKKREECSKNCPDDSSNDKGGGITANDKSSANNNNHLNNSNFNSRTSSNHVADQRNLDELLEFINGRSTKDNDKSISKKKQDQKSNNNNNSKVPSKNKSNTKSSSNVATKNIPTSHKSAPIIINSTKSQTNNATAKNGATKSLQSNGSCNVGGKIKPQNVTTKCKNIVKKSSDETNNTNDSTTKRNNNINNNNIINNNKKIQNPKLDILSPNPATLTRAQKPGSKQKDNSINNMSRDTNLKTNHYNATRQKSKVNYCDDCDCSLSGQDDVFMPKQDIDLNDDGLDDLEKELEAFKRFCFDSLPLVKKERVRLNLNSDFFKKPI